MPISRIERKHVVKFVAEISKKRATRVSGKERVEVGPLSHQSVTHIAKLLTLALESAFNEGLARENVARGVPIPRRELDSRLDKWTFLSLDEIADLEAIPYSHQTTQGHRIEGSITLKQRTVFLVAIYCGLRAGELWGLRWCDVDLDAASPTLTVRFSHGGPTKSGKARVLPLQTDSAGHLHKALAALREWRAVSPGIGTALVFPSKDGNSRARHEPGYDAQWPRVRRLIGLRAGARFHDLRHTCASQLVQGGWGRAWPLVDVAAYLGHSSQRVTERYAHLSPAYLSRAVENTTVSRQLLDNKADLNGSPAGRIP
jgi:integrase